MRDYKFTEVDLKAMGRDEIYPEYRGISFFVTIDIDVTRYAKELKGKVKFYPFMTYVVSKVCNDDPDFRMAEVDGKVGYFDRVDPIYTLLRSNKMFTHKVTTYSDDFIDFYKRYLVDKEIGEKSDRLYADGGRPFNSVSVSTMPHTNYKSISFTYDVSEVNKFVPFTTFGQVHEENGKYICPVAIQFFHGVNDGYHAEKYIAALQDTINTLDIDLSRL